ncbi:MAG: ATP-binding protein, partial [Planctomycetota bacterium]
AGRMEVRVTDLSIADVFEALTILLGPLAMKKQVTVNTQIIPHVPIVQTDGGKLQQILYNFLSNAIKFSPQGGTIDLTARRDDGQHARITVRDEGPGVPEDQQAAIFEKFKQLDAGVTREHAGTGLGLAISTELADLLGGEIGVESEPGHGATFWLRLPLTYEAKPNAEHKRVATSAS